MLATKPDPDPTKTNFSFLGWYEKDDAGEYKAESFKFTTTPITEDLKLYAKWEAKGRYTRSLNLNDAIDLHFYIRYLDDFSVATIKFTDWKGNTTEGNITEIGELLEDGAYKFTLAEYDAREMVDTVHVVVKSNGEELWKADYSVQEYCEAVKASSLARKYKDLCQSALNYGSAAQLFFDYKTETLANPDFEPSTVAGIDVPDMYAKKDVGTCTGVKKSNMSLALIHETSLTVSFVPKSIGSPLTKDKYSISVKDAYGNVIDCEPVENPANGRLLVKITGIAAMDLNMNFTVTITKKNSDGSLNPDDSMTVTLSALSYAYAAYNQTADEKLNSLGKAIYDYYLKAAAL